MKKFYLEQMFAEDIENGGDAGENGSKDEAGKDEKKYSDADLDKIISKKFAKWQAEQAKRVSEAERLAKMSEEERTKAERDAMKKELDALKREKNLATMHAEARKLLQAEQITVGDELIGMIVNADDAEATKTAVSAFAAAYKAAVQDGVKAALRGKAPKTGGNGSGRTKKDILAVEDPIERQRLIRENMDLFKA